MPLVTANTVTNVHEEANLNTVYIRFPILHASSSINFLRNITSYINGTIFMDLC